MNKYLYPHLLLHQINKIDSSRDERDRINNSENENVKFISIYLSQKGSSFQLRTESQMF